MRRDLVPSGELTTGWRIRRRITDPFLALVKGVYVLWGIAAE